MTEPRQCPDCGAELPADAPSGLCPRCLLKQGFESKPEGLAETAAPGSRFTAPSPGELARRFPQLELLELLGQGGMGAVYKARQPTLDRLVAIKILPVEVGRDPAFAERFTREARALARLSHPNIVGIYDFGQVDGLYYFVMEYVDGVSLRQLVEQRGLSPQQALALVPQICEALQFAHDERIVHRDVKPENILLDKRGRVKIADFGLAKLLGRSADEATLTRVEQVMGTPLYMAPEQMQGSHGVDHRADIYSLGVVFYEMLTGELPLGRFAPPSHKVQIDVRLDEVVLRTLEREPEQRYQHASDVKTDVEAIVTRSDRPTPTAAAPPTSCPAQVRAPAIGLLIAGIFNWLCMPLVGGAIALGHVTLPSTGLARSEVVLLAVAGIAILVLSACIMMAALKMMRCQAYPLAIVGSVLAMLVSPGNIIGLPIGIWALVVLSQREVRTAFARAPSGGAMSRHGHAIANTHAWVVLICLSGVVSGWLPWAGLVWYGTDPTGAPNDPSRWNERWLYGWGSWEGKAVMAMFLLVALSRLASGFPLRPRLWQPLSLIVGAVGIVALCYWSTQERIVPELPAFISNLIRVELQPGLTVPIALAIALLMIAAVEFRHVSEAFSSVRTADALPAGGRPEAGTVKLAVEPIADRPATVTGTSAPLSADPSNEELIVRALRRSRNRIRAIRLYRDLTGAGLAAAKIAVETIAAKHAIELRALSTRERAWQIAAASLVLVAVATFASVADISEYVQVILLIVVSVLYMAFLACHGIGARRDRIRANRIALGAPEQVSPRAAFFTSLMRSRRALRALQWLLSLVGVACFLVFFNFHSVGRHDSQGHWQSSYAVGSPTPWFLFETWPAANTPICWNFTLSSSSWLFALLAFAVCYAAWRIEKVLHPQAGFWSGSPQMVLIGWWLVAMFVSGFVMWMGYRSLHWNISPAKTTGSEPAAEADQ